MPFNLVDVHDADAQVGSLSVSIQNGENSKHVQVHAIDLRVGPQESGLTRRVKFAPALAATPLVFCQSVMQGSGFSDIFVVTVVESSSESVAIKIDRLDGGGGGWGADLHVHILLVVPVN